MAPSADGSAAPRRSRNAAPSVGGTSTLVSAGVTLRGWGSTTTTRSPGDNGSRPSASRTRVMARAARVSASTRCAAGSPPEGRASGDGRERRSLSMRSAETSRAAASSSPRCSAERRPSRTRAMASGSGAASSRSTPARRAATASSTWPAGSCCSACMSSASVIVTPSKASSSRSRSVITSRDSDAGRSLRPVSAGTATCADMTSRGPAASAVRNTASSRSCSVATSTGTTPSS